MRLQLPIALLLLTVGSASAAPLVAIDLFGPGDGRVTRDADAGLDWLDLIVTGSLVLDPHNPRIVYPSYDAIVGNVGGWAADGWRHATAEEICRLFITHAVAPDPCPGDEILLEGDRVSDLQALLGITGTTTSGIPFVQISASSGVFGEPDPTTGLVGRASLVLTRSVFHTNSIARVVPGTVLTGFEYSYGHFLVRPIPEPATALLLGAGLAALAVRRR